MTRARRGENASHMGNELLGVIERVESLEAEKRKVADSIREEYQEAKSRGFNVKTIKRLIGDRKKDEVTRGTLTWPMPKSE